MFSHLNPKIFETKNITKIYSIDTKMVQTLLTKRILHKIKENIAF